MKVRFIVKTWRNEFSQMRQKNMRKSQNNMRKSLVVLSGALTCLLAQEALLQSNLSAFLRARMG